MNILFLTSRLPHPPDRGDRLRTLQFLHLFSREHTVTLVSFVANEKERVLARELEPYCKKMHLVNLPSWRSTVGAALNVWRDIPLQALYYRSRRMKRLIDELIAAGSFDMAYVHLFRMAPYLDSSSQLYRVLDLTDLISHEVQSSLSYRSFLSKAIYHFEEPRIARYEQQIAACFDEVWFISKRDRDLFSNKGGQANVQVIPNSINETLFLLDRDLSGSEILLFVGNLDVMHNIDAVTYMAEDIMPLILEKAPGCRLQIVGAGDIRNVKRPGSYPGIEVIGYVPDLKTVLTRSAIAVAPLRFSAGIQFKVLESMGAGLPVVTSSAVSEGSGAVPEQHLLVGDSAAEFAHQVVRLLQDKRLREQIGRAGRDFAREHFTSQVVLDRLQAIEKNSFK